MITNSSEVTLDFSLSCDHCDDGYGAGERKTVEQAIAAGWTDINEDRDGMSWNYLGRCPRCTKELADE